VKHLGAIFLGFLVACLISCLIVGPQSTVLLLLIVVLCTYGFGLIPLVLVSWALGLLVIGVFSGKSGTPTRVRGSQPLGPAVQRRRQLEALTTYIQKARSNGRDDNFIRDCLLDNGWDAAEIQEAFAATTTQG
jgi:hypothetical protein